MKIPMFTITISLDDEQHMLIPELQETGAVKTYHRRDKVAIIEQCVRVLTKQIMSTPTPDERDD